MDGRTRSLEDPVEIVCSRCKTLLVIWFSAQSGHDYVVRSGARVERNRKDADGEQGAPHITPHLRRNSHSETGRPSKRKKTMGMFQSSFVLRMEMPASE